MNYSLEIEQEADGRWLAEVPELPGVLAYGASSEEAMARAQALALRVLAEQLEHGEARPVDIRISLPAAACPTGLRPKQSGYWLHFSALGGASNGNQAHIAL